MAGSARFHAGFNRGFEHFRANYADLLGGLVRRRFVVPAVAGLISILGGVLFTSVGRDFFPAIDAGQIQLHVRAPPGTRIETTTQRFQAIENRFAKWSQKATAILSSTISACRRALTITRSWTGRRSASTTA